MEIEVSAQDVHKDTVIVIQKPCNRRMAKWITAYPSYETLNIYVFTSNLLLNDTGKCLGHMLSGKK